MSYPQDVDKNRTLQFTTSWRRLIPFIVGGVGVLLIVAGLLYNLWKQSLVKIVETDEGRKDITTDSVKGVNSVKFFKVDVSGAVQKPGVVEIPDDSRIQDVLISAGGFDANADRIYISKYINLAQPVEDGMKIYIPFQGEAGNTALAGQTGTTDSFNINVVSQAKLEELPGVGPVTAKKIFDGRPYGRLDELIEKKIVSRSVYEKIKDQVTIY